MIGEETKAQILAKEGRLPDAVIACISGVVVAQMLLAYLLILSLKKTLNL